MSSRKFYWQLICKAFSWPWVCAQGISFILSLVLGIVVWKHPNWEGTLSVMLWAVPLGIFAATLVVSSVLAPYYLNKDVERRHNEDRQRQDEIRKQIEDERERLRNRIAELEARSVPTLSADEARLLEELRNRLVVGIREYEVPMADRPVLEQLNLRQIVRLEQRLEASGPRSYDVGCWVLTDLGKTIVTARLAIRVKEPYEGNGEAGLVFVNAGPVSLVNCRARILALDYETPSKQWTLSRLPRTEDLACDKEVATNSEGKIPLFRWGMGITDKNLDIVYQNKIEGLPYGVAGVPILTLINVWAENAQTMYAICKLEDRLGSGYKLTLLRAGVQVGNLSLAAFQTPPG